MSDFPKNLIQADDLNSEHLKLIFDKAKYFEDNFTNTIQNGEHFPDLKGRTVALAFFENSTRTRNSFELAAKRLSSDVLNFSANQSSLAKGESIADTIRTIDAMMVDIYVVRNQYNGTPAFIASITNNIVVNAGDGKHEHPTQAILDAYTILKHYGKVDGLNVSIIGDIINSRVARSNITMLRTLGADVKLFGPGTLLPRHLNCWNAPIHDNINDAIEWSDVIILLRIQNERMDSGLLPSISEYVKFYQINVANFAKKDKIILLHPGPVNYGVELEHNASKLHNSMIDRQVTNGVFTRMAVLSLLANR
ncbi:MAG: aspartate carbamoyltransferase catalytic subunit [Ignavibacteria bacterium]|jgi:aspartate carbamoyltransferase catalytic subunit|nr:aspartate carbamoyltransferase catalytic subunit [Ignavibacteria bacterium]